MTRFIKNSDGTISDTETNLIWQATASKNMTWHEAMALERDGWRLPTISELVSLIDYNRCDPASEFPCMESAGFWSSSPYACSSNHAWRVYFYNGYAYFSSKYYEGRVRLVRAGQLLGIDDPARETDKLKTALAVQTELLADANAQLNATRADRDRYKAWHDAQVNKNADCRVYGHDNFGFARFKFDGQEPEVGTEYILRPKPLKENE